MVDTARKSDACAREARQTSTRSSQVPSPHWRWLATSPGAVKQVLENGCLVVALPGKSAVATLTLVRQVSRPKTELPPRSRSGAGWLAARLPRPG